MKTYRLTKCPQCGSLYEPVPEGDCVHESLNLRDLLVPDYEFLMDRIKYDPKIKEIILPLSGKKIRIG